ncbi:condensation domain-containing protein, partial [Aquimarina addita]|uniref:condensation domain-containing protein n=1 Tax=Aquimarina addita TaxID=870485 RepID=UPI0031ED2CBE
MDKKVYSLLKTLKKLGCNLYLEGENLNVEVFKDDLSLELKNEIAKYRNDLIDFLNRDNKNHTTIPNVPELYNYELSSSQKRLWTLSQFDQGNISYNMPSQFYLKGYYDINSFRKAITSVIYRHEILRTIFEDDDDGNVRQRILPYEKSNFFIDSIDLSREKNKNELIDNYIRNDSYKAFELDKGPLIRCSLFKLSNDNHLFYYNLHHIIADGWSFEILSRDILSYYEAYKNKNEPRLPKLRIQYKDYAQWQLNQLKSDSYQSHRFYWLDKLSGNLPVLELPKSTLRPKIMSNKGGRLKICVSRKAKLDLNQFSKNRNGTLFMTIVSSLKILLYKYTQEKDIIIGTPVANRNHVDLENQIGAYLNTLVIRNQIKESDSFDKLYDDVKTTLLNAYTHQEYQFDDLVNELKLQRDISRNPIFDIMVVLQNKNEYNFFDADDLSETTDIEYLGKLVTKFDLLFNFYDNEDNLFLIIDYNEDLYDQKAIGHLAIHYRELLSSIADNPDMAIEDLSMLTPKEEHQLLKVFNDTQVEYPKDKTVIDLFEEQVKNNPEHIA